MTQRMIQIRFERQGEAYRRIVELPDGRKFIADNLTLPKEWHSPEPWPWVRPFREYSREELEVEGREIAAYLLGQEGTVYVREQQQIFAPLQVVVLESRDLPELARVPWELACLGDRFLAIDPFTPIIRRPDYIRLKDRLRIRNPLHLALISAVPKGYDSLPVEEELLNASLALGDQVAEGKIIVDEVLNCTREKLRKIFRSNTYDIIFFIGHGWLSDSASDSLPDSIPDSIPDSVSDHTGCLIMESPDGDADPVSGQEFGSLLHRQMDLSLVLLSCCNAAAVSKAENEGWLGFKNVARSVLDGGVPEVVATQAAAFNAAGRKVMKAFFREFCLCLDGSRSNGGSSHGFNVAKALSQARSEVEADHSQFHDFYHFVHFSALTPELKIKVRTTRGETEESIRSDWRDRVIYRTPNYLPLDGSFIGRFLSISQIEDAWRYNSVKVVGIYGPGGIGKTFLCNHIEERMLSHHLPAMRFERSIWIDFQEGVGNTLAGFLTQLTGLALDLGFPIYREVLDNSRTFPTPREKLRPLVEHLKKSSEGTFLLVLDNLETILDERGNFHDPELGAWFRELLAHTPARWKVLVTCRFQFPFFPDERQPIKTKWFPLAELGFTERIRLINQQTELRRRPDKEKAEMIRLVGGIPYLVKLMVGYLQRHSDLPHDLLAHDLLAPSKEAATYARLDWFLSLLTTEERDWLFIAAALPPPRPAEGIVVARAIRDSIEDLQPLESGFDASLRKLLDLSLVTVDDEGSIHLHPLITYQLLQNQGSGFRYPLLEIRKINRAIGDLFYLLSEQVTDQPSKTRVLIQGIEPILSQDDSDLLNAYLQECATTFYGTIPVSAFSDIVRRIEDVLFEKADEDSFCTLGLCAQALLDMKDLRTAISIFERMLASSRLPDTLRGKVLHAIGMVCQERQQWETALENYRLALEWNEKTDNQAELGATYYQIGIIREDKGEFSIALSAFADGLAISLQTECDEGITKNLASLRRIIPKVTDEEIKRIREILPDEVFQKVISGQ